MPVPLAPERVLGWTGYRVDDVHGRGVGKVEAVLVDRESGSLQWLLVRLSSPAGQYTALPLVTDMLAGAGHVLTPWTKDRILSAPRVNESGALSARNEAEACKVFGVPPTRGAGLSRWERRATSARLLNVRHWTPEPRGSADERRTGIDRRTGEDRRVPPPGADPSHHAAAARPVPAALLEAQQRVAGRREQDGDRREGAWLAVPAVHRPIAPGLATKHED